MADESAIRGKDQIIVVWGYGAYVRVVDHLRKASFSVPVLLPVDPDSAFLI